MRVHKTIEGVEWSRVAEMFAAVGWGNRLAAEVAAAFAKSSSVAFVFDEQVLAGFGRTVDDGRYYAMIVDVVVDPDYQRHGVGALIMASLTESLRGYLQVSLTAAPDVQPFYQRLGWKKLKTAMLLPRSPQQERENCETD